MNMDWLDRFMQGKKKYSAAVILPIIIAVLNVMLAGNPHLDSIIQLVQEFAPTLIALIGGIVYTVVEGGNDKAKIVVSNGSAATAAPSTTAAAAAQPPAPPMVATGTPSYGPQSQQWPQGQTEPPKVLKEQSVRFDSAAFLKRADDLSQQRYGAIDDTTKFYSARDLIWYALFPFWNKTAVREAAELLVSLVHTAFKQQSGMTYEEALEKVQTVPVGVCRRKTLEEWAMAAQAGGTGDWYDILLDLRSIEEWRNELSDDKKAELYITKDAWV